MEPQAHVFISYAREDFDVADRIYHHLREAGISAWLDKQSLLPGQRWQVEVKRAIRTCRYFLALLSSKSVTKRGYVQKELKEALDVLDEFPDSQIFVVPVRLDECSPSHEKLKEIHWVDLFPSYREGLQSVLRALQPDLFGCIHLASITGEPTTVSHGDTITVCFTITNTGTRPCDVWMGASLVDHNGHDFYDTSQDTGVTVELGTREYLRALTVPRDTTLGHVRLFGGVYLGKPGSPASSVRLDRTESEEGITVR